MAKSAGFLGKQHADKTRAKIKVTQIVNRMNNVALGLDLTMDSQQLRAAEILLKKALPDLSSVLLDNTSSDGSMTPRPDKIELIGIQSNGNGSD